MALSLLPKTTWSSPIHSIRTTWSSLFTPEPRGPLLSPQNHVVLLLFLQNLVALSFPLQNCMALFLSLRTTWSSLFPIHFIRTVWTSTYLLASEPRGSLLLLQNLVALSLSTCFRTSWFSLSMAAVPRFKSQRPSSFAAPFPTPPILLQSVTPASIPFSSSFTGLP